MYYTNHLLLANPTAFQPNSLYDQSIIYVFYHGKDGALGYVINKQMQSPPRDMIRKEIGIEVDVDKIHIGGDRDMNKGYVLHTTDYGTNGTSHINKDIAMSQGMNVLHDIRRGTGPAQYQIIFGRLQWEAGKLDQEITTGSPVTNKPLWIPVKFNTKFLFDNKAWDSAIVDYVAEKSHDFLSKY